MSVRNASLAVLLTLVVSFVVGMYLGYKYCDHKNQLAWAEYRQSVAQQNLQVSQQVQDLTQKLSEATQKLDQEAHHAKTDIDTAYESMLDSLQQPADTSDSEAVPADPAPSGKVSACKCRYDAESRQAFRKLRASILTLTRDCDITASYYNELLKLHNDYVNQLNK